MTSAQIEHVNITVADVARSAEVMEAIFGWKIRWSGLGKMGGRTIHVGTDEMYLAVYSNGAAPPNGRLNHVGVVVADLEEAERRVRAAGLKPHSHADYNPGRRFYFHDHDGIEFEVVSYA